MAPWKPWNAFFIRWPEIGTLALPSQVFALRAAPIMCLSTRPAFPASGAFRIRRITTRRTTRRRTLSTAFAGTTSPRVPRFLPCSPTTWQSGLKCFPARPSNPPSRSPDWPMRVVVQRVSRARVTVDGQIAGEIGAGLVILLGVGRDDTSNVAQSMAEKAANLRIFEDPQGKMNLSLLDTKGSALVVSQFTLYGDARGQRRPSFIAAAPPDLAKTLYEEFCAALRRIGVTVATGVFQTMMSVELVNEGPVTILLDSDKTF